MSANKSQTILIVDDDRLIREILRSILKKMNIKVFEAESCTQAMNHLECQKFDAILLDNNMPDGQGVHLLPKITPKCQRVIMITADDYRIRSDAIALGAEEVFSKPFDFNALKKHITKK